MKILLLLVKLVCVCSALSIADVFQIRLSPLMNKQKKLYPEFNVLLIISCLIMHMEGTGTLA